jgi:mxaL protein
VIRRSAPLLLAALLLGLALVMPPLELPRAGYRFLLVFDITQSMNVADAGPPQSPRRRLEAAREAVAAAIDDFPCGVEAGLGLFAGHRTLVLFAPVEVCAHRRDLHATLDDIDWWLAWEARSEVAKGLHQAIAAADRLGRATRVVFLTDGHEAPPLHPQYRRRFTGDPDAVGGIIVGVGDTRPMPIPRLDRGGETLGYWRPDEVQQVDSYSLGRAGTSIPEAMVGVDPGDLQARIRAGTEHLSSRRDDHLRELADETGLAYAVLGDGDRLAERLLRADLADYAQRPTDLRPLPAALALVLVLAGWWPALRARLRGRPLHSAGGHRDGMPG